MDTQLLKSRLKYLSEFTKIVHKEIEPFNFYPKGCINLIITWIDEVRDMVEDEEKI